jgi:hypothetical protein
MVGDFSFVFCPTDGRHPATANPVLAEAKTALSKSRRSNRVIWLAKPNP